MQNEPIYQSPNFKNINMSTSFFYLLHILLQFHVLGELDYFKVNAKYDIVYEYYFSTALF